MASQFNLQKYNQYVVPITGKNKSYIGTGFVIAELCGVTYIVTCYHVVTEVGRDGPLYVADKQVDDVVAFEPDFDIAILKVEEMLGASKLSLHTEYDNYIDTNTWFHIVGFHKSGGQSLIEPLQGKLMNTYHVASPRLQKQCIAWKLNVKKGKLVPGYSGSPLLSERGEVLGIVSHRKGEESGRAIAVSALRMMILPEELISVIPTNLSYIDHNTKYPQVKPLVNFTDEIRVYKNIISREDTQTRLIFIQGSSGTGKSRLLDEYEKLATNEQIENIRLNLKSQTRIIDCLSQIISKLGVLNFSNFRNFRSLQSSPSDKRDFYTHLTLEFFCDLEEYSPSPPIFIFLDEYEKANPDLKDWLENIFLPMLDSTPLVAVIAGQDVLQDSLLLKSIKFFNFHEMNEMYFHKYVSLCRASTSTDVIQAFHMMFKNSPKSFFEYVDMQVQKDNSQI